MPAVADQGADVLPSLVEGAHGLLYGATLYVRRAGVVVVKQHLTQVEHGGHAGRVFLHVFL